MPFHIVNSDITKMEVDAIVNAANSSLLGGGGVDGAIHRAAGPKLLAECLPLNGCRPGHAKITKGYDLPAKYVIHAVGPIYIDGHEGEKPLLESCYRESLRLAKENGAQSIAFPLISAGAFGYPKDEALQVAASCIREFLEENEMDVYLAILFKSDFHLPRELGDDLSAELSRAPAPSSTGGAHKPLERRLSFRAGPRAAALLDDQPSKGDIDSYLKERDESFSEMLLRKIDELGMSDVECYKRANVDRKLFSKIRSDRLYRPRKQTVIAFAFALKLPIDELEEMLNKAGFALSGALLFDRIVCYFVKKGNYDVYLLNEALFAYDQPLVGA